jgi:anion-transporting  ArsA/GET3 family ATPase
VYRDEPQIGEALRELRLEALNISTETAGTLHVALSPTCIKTIFPPAVLVPTFGAAKEVRVKELYDEVDKLLDDLDELDKYSKKIKNILNLSSKESLMFVYPSKARKKEIRRAVLEYFKKTKERIIVLLVGPEKNSEELMKELGDSMLFKTIAYAAPLTERAAVYLASLLYNLAHEESYIEELARGSEKVDKLDRSVFEWYNYLLRVQINEAQIKMRDRDKILDEDILNSIESILEAKGREVGSLQAYLFYLNAAFPENINYLDKIIEYLKNTRKSYEELIKIISREIYPEGLDVRKVLDDELFSDINLICDYGRRFLKRVTDLNSKIEKTDGLRNLINEISDLMSFLDTIVYSDKFIDNVNQAANLVKDIIVKSSENVSESIAKDLAYILISHILKGKDLDIQPNTINEVPIKLNNFIAGFIYPAIRALDRVERPLKNFEVDISYRISEISDALQSLMKNINDLKELARIKEETGMKVKVKECLLRLSLIDGIRLEGGRQAKSTKGFLSAFVENIYNHDEYIRSFKEKIENIEKSLEKFENVIKEIGDQSKLLENANITHDELLVSIKYDLSLLSEMRIYEMDQYIENIYEIINTMVTKLKSFENEILKHSDPRMERLISKILSDVYGG